MMPKEFAAVFEQKQKEKGWADATCAATFYQALEDHILSAIMKPILAKPIAHLSLHFDGVRVDKARVQLEGGDGDHMCHIWRMQSKRILDSKLCWWSRSI